MTGARPRVRTVAVPHLPGAACANHARVPAAAWTTDEPMLARAAAVVCLDECPVQRECAVWHAANGQPPGVWAGRWVR